jgi:DNA-binding XRE family transcriptional regulator
LWEQAGKKITYKNIIPPFLSKKHIQFGKVVFTKVRMTEMDLPPKLRQLRIKAKLTQEKLAEYLMLPVTTISKIENGRQVPDAVTYENWLWVCTHEAVKFIYIRKGGNMQHA